MGKFLPWLNKVVASICNRPDHLQRLAVIGAGVFIYPAVWGLIFIVWKGFGDHADLYHQQLSILGWALFGSMGLWGLVVVAMLGTIKGLKIDGPGGVGVELNTTADDLDVDPHTQRDTRLGAGRRHSGDDDSGSDDQPAPQAPKPPAPVTA